MEWLLWLLVVIVATLLIYAMLPPSDKEEREAARRRSLTWTPPPKEEPASVKEDPLDSYYQPARMEVPDDFPRQKIGACPYTKAQKDDLPLANVPMCLAQKSESMKLPTMI
jgi:hypothetical protein